MEAMKGPVVICIRKINFRFNIKNGVTENCFSYLPEK